MIDTQIKVYHTFNSDLPLAIKILDAMGCNTYHTENGCVTFTYSDISDKYDAEQAEILLEKISDMIDAYPCGLR